MALSIRSVLTTLPYLTLNHEQTRTAPFDSRWVLANPGSHLFSGPSFLGVRFHTFALKEETACAGVEELFQKL